jgi:putative Ca2+/H+ antiporter (TMEM165/GDT1 family)
LQGFLPSLLVVAVAEIGDKTQLLALLLAARFRRPVPILLGIALATLANHALAGALGAWVRTMMAPDLLRWPLAASFLALALWVLRPDRLDESGAPGPARFGPFLVTLALFFLAEMGDKTQFATIALGARYPDLAAVVAGTSLGLLAANLPPVLFGCAAAHRIPMRPVRWAAAALFAAMGVATAAGWVGL